MNNFRSAILIVFALAGFVLCPFATQAYQIEKLADAPVSGDFVLNQTKTEIKLNPGESASRPISLVNRSGQDLLFTVSVEDFSASVKPGQNIDLLGDQTGLYSLKDFIRPEATGFTLRQGEKITLPVDIKIPANAQPGALYGAVIFAAKPLTAASAGSANIQTVPRLASLFFVRVSGEVAESGELLDFFSSRWAYFGGPLAFEFNYKNTGTVYLNPYGELKITDIFGRQAAAKWIAPYFVLPGAIRQQKETVENGNLFGLYQATLKLNRGYGNRIDQKSLYFFVLPIWRLVEIIIALIILGWLVWRAKKYLKKIKPA